MLLKPCHQLFARPVSKASMTLGSDSPSNLPDIDYDKLMPNRRSLGENGVCNCGFCKIGRLNGKDYLTHHNSIDLQFTVTQLKLKNAAIIAML